MSSLGRTVRGMASRAAALATLATLLLAAGPAFAQEEAPPGMSAFAPVQNLPPAERMAHGALWVAAYAVVWVGLLLFLWVIWRRLAKVDEDLRRAESRRK
ncbi:MAG: hypothetical protein KGN76_00160 [Acidobacteriota bacterium]|nr:hypothetical protein [Acidobacteriota bacterium]